MSISEQFIASLLSRIDLVDLIGQKISLRRAGANFVGLCPFHHEKTPSFTVNKDKQFFHCFGCKASGDAIKFIMLIEQKNFLNAVSMLADQYGLILEKEPKVAIDPVVEKIYHILELAVDFYHQELFKNNHSSQEALNYFINRNINIETIKYFKLGFANHNWDSILNFFSQTIQDQHPDFKSLLLQAGLILEKNGKFYDRFRARVMFPIRNKFGKTIGFGARVLNAEQMPKYLNSPETIVFSKQQELYGLAEAKNKLKNFNNLIVVEGYFDVLTAVQQGIDNIVATLGTALNKTHIRIMLSVAPEINFCFDGDLAGYKASIKAMELAMDLLTTGLLSSKHTIRFVTLPNNYDPDLLIRKKGVQEFKQLIVEAKSLSDFFFDYLLKKYPEKNIENLNQLAQEAKLQIDKIQDPLFQDLWYEKLASLLGITSDALKSKKLNFNKTVKNSKYLPAVVSKVNNNNYPVSNAHRALAMLLVDQTLLRFCVDLAEDQFLQLQILPDLSLFIKVIRILAARSQAVNSNNNINRDELMAQLEPVYAQKLALIDPQKIVQFIPRTGIEQEFIGSVKRIKRELMEQKLESLLVISKDRNLVDQEKLLLQQILQEL